MELEARKMEKEKHEEAVKATEAIEAKAFELRKQDEDLRSKKKEVKESLKEVQEAIKETKEHLDNVAEEKQFEQREAHKHMFRQLYKEHRSKRKSEYEHDLSEKKKKHDDLEESCKPAKVRTYACGDDQKRTVKYLNYEYDFDEGKCVEKVQTKKSKCEESNKRHGFTKSKHFEGSNMDELDDYLNENGYKDDEDIKKAEKAVSKKMVKPAAKKAVKKSKVQRRSADEIAGDSSDAEEEETKKAAPVAKAKKMSLVQKLKKTTQRSADSLDEDDQGEYGLVMQKSQDGISKKDKQVEELKKLNQHMGAIEGKVTDLSNKYQELKLTTAEKLQIA